MTARFNTRYGKPSIIQSYAPTNDEIEDRKDLFYSELNQAISAIPKHGVLIVMGDPDAKVGSDNTGVEHVMGKETVGQINNNG